MDWMELLSECLHILLPSVCGVIVILLGIVGAKIKSIYESKCNDETSKAVVNDVVKFVEQVYKDLKGDEKLQKALTRASTILNEKGITISEAELNMLIESAVYGLNQGLKGEDIKMDIKEDCDNVQHIQAPDEGVLADDGPNTGSKEEEAVEIVEN